MGNWLTRNSRTIIKSVYILPILIAAGVSISHVIAWYGLTNPMSWAIYLSIGIEIAALSALAGITTKIGNGAYIPFLIVTFIQLVGNIFFAYQYIDINSVMFKDWVDLVGGIYGHGDIGVHRRVLAFIGGGFIPMISLSFLHLLVSFTNETVTKSNEEEPVDKQIDENTVIEETELPEDIFSPKPDIVSRYTPEEVVKRDSREAVIKKWEDSGILTNLKSIIEESVIEESVVEEPKLDVKGETIDSDVNVGDLIEKHKKEKDKKISIDKIKEVKDRRKFSVPIPKRSNSIERIGSNKTLEHGKSDKITFKRNDGENK